jgi:hypothetical protein
MRRPGPQTQSKRQREHAKREKRRAKDERRAARRAAKSGAAKGSSEPAPPTASEGLTEPQTAQPQHPTTTQQA